MAWADNYIEKLQLDEVVEFRPRGNSMTPLIESRQLVTVLPVDEETNLEKGMIVLCRVSGNQYLHKISAIKNDRYQISNNRGYINGWTSRDKIYGKYVTQDAYLKLLEETNSE